MKRLISGLLVVLVFPACGRSSAMVLAPDNGSIRAHVRGSTAVIVNRSSHEQTGIEVLCTCYQPEVHPHTMGHGQWHTPSGWYQNLIKIERLGPDETIERTLRYNIGSRSVSQYPSSD